MSSKFVGIVSNEVEKEIRSQLNAPAGGCLQFGGWTDPAGAQLFTILYGAPLPFYVTAFWIVGLRESSANIVENIKEVTSRLWPVVRRNVASSTAARMLKRGDGDTILLISWVRARNNVIEAGTFLVAYGFSAHAMSNLCKDVLKLPSANKQLVICTIVAKNFGNRYLPRAPARAGPTRAQLEAAHVAAAVADEVYWRCSPLCHCLNEQKFY
jgi:hypothetical protein